MSIYTAMDLPAPVSAEGGLDTLNKWLGRREAFALVAGRCSAADVECMRRIRDQKLYLSRAADWNEFCQNQLHMSKSNANRLIGLLDKFGPEYFHIAQITRVSVAEYRAIAPSVTARGIEANGELIPLTPENSDRIAAAVSALRQARTAKPEPGLQDRLTALDASADRLLHQFYSLSQSHGPANPYISGALDTLHRKVAKARADCS